MLAVAGAAGLIATGLCAPGAGQALTMRTVSDVSNRFTLDVPVTWQVKTSTGDPALAAIGPAPGKGMMPDTVNVIVRHLAVALTPQECAQKAQGVLKYIIHSYTTVAEGPDTIGNLPAYDHVYTWQTKTGEPRRSVQVCTTRGYQAYVIIGTTGNTPARVQAVMPEIRRIVATFHPTGEGQETPFSLRSGK